MSSRQRVETALAHRQPDRTPVDFLAVPEIWHQLVDHFGIEPAKPGDDQFFDPVWEAVLDKLDVDCRVISFDQFCAPPASAFAPKGRPEVWNVQSRSTPARMWRWKTDGFATDVFGRGFREVANASGVYEENIATLAGASTLAEIQAHTWPDPDWWDFSSAKSVVEALNRNGAKHIRFRMGTVFELAWQMRGMEKFLMELADAGEVAGTHPRGQAGEGPGDGQREDGEEEVSHAQAQAGDHRRQKIECRRRHAVPGWRSRSLRCLTDQCR